MSGNGGSEPSVVNSMEDANVCAAARTHSVNVRAPGMHFIALRNLARLHTVSCCNTPVIQAFYQALQISVILGKCDREPIIKDTWFVAEQKYSCNCQQLLQCINA